MHLHIGPKFAEFLPKTDTKVPSHFAHSTEKAPHGFYFGHLIKYEGMSFRVTRWSQSSIAHRRPCKKLKLLSAAFQEIVQCFKSFKARSRPCAQTQLIRDSKRPWLRSLGWMKGKKH
ncbi:hypothetical protein TNCV_4593491 [Trichonephila clavipes]|uniref:Uncharacterized protein n=1 Tax=Trichonephila clavipes TaxID=2585209 RepID=A0A8X6WEP0_TRICX|nr:hypothetical protein TNCV_4593491 [Trichonephila clavipes]